MVGGGGFTTVELNEGRTHLSAYWRETPLGDNMVATISPSMINAVRRVVHTLLTIVLKVLKILQRKIYNLSYLYQNMFQI